MTGGTAGEDVAADVDAVVGDLLRRALDVAAWTVPALVVDVLGPALDARGLRLLLVDHELVELHEVAAWPSGPQGRSRPVDGDREVEPAGWAFRRRAVVRDARGCLHQPVHVRGHRLGVLVAEGPGEGAEGLLAAAAPAVALLLRQAAGSSDLVEVRRRSHAFSIAAELQWDVLPPPGHRGPGVELAGLVEPAYLATSDLFDWAVDDDVAWLALLEASGEGLAAARAADLALGALRHGRRSGSSLADQVATADDVLAREHRGGATVDAALVRLDLADGTAEVHVAGDAVVLHRREGDLGPLHVVAGPPLGAGEEDRAGREVALTPGEELVLVSSGVLRALSPRGAAFGLAGVRAALDQAEEVLDAPRSVARAVREHAGGQVERDATSLVVRWSGPPAGAQAGRRPGA
ncbi:SpoIIE family protein phosphatase [Pseudokineococcus basanitobsidens]|uniref:SpoIIE family protein phosphatase n=1 Tax=Pseudokineococcus basanitobsidens TaxID=1926649 RepID=A0ABU8RHT0_9ACTN